MNTSRLEKANKIIDGEMAIWTSVCLPDTGVGIAQDFLTRVWRISPTTAIHITANITIGVSDVVLVPGIELVIREAFEGLAPEENTFLKRQSDPLQEESILKSAEMFQMVVLA